MLFIIQQEWYRGIGDKLPSLRIEMEVFLLQKGGQDDGRISEVQTTVFFTTGACMDWAGKEYIEKAPQWCSVDLRDGNQALIIPMSLDEKIEFSSCL